MKPKTSVETQFKAKHYFNIAQYRSDCWNNLKQSAARLHKRKGNTKTQENYQKKLKESLDSLRLIEKFFAYPGLDFIERLEAMEEKSEFTALHHKISDVVRSLIGESYRSNRQATEDEEKRNQMLNDEAPKDSKEQNYFEVVFVDELSADDRGAMLNKFERVRQKNEQFTYEVIVLPSFEDALIALLFNPNIQAMVIRSDIRYESTEDLSKIGRAHV